jgi:hypothetical protein
MIDYEKLTIAIALGYFAGRVFYELPTIIKTLRYGYAVWKYQRLKRKLKCD